MRLRYGMNEELDRWYEKYGQPSEVELEVSASSLSYVHPSHRFGWEIGPFRWEVAKDYPYLSDLLDIIKEHFPETLI